MHITLGVAGRLSVYSESLPYKILLTYRHNEGTYERPYNKDENIFNFYSNLRLLNKPVQIDIKTGIDLNSVKEPVFGAGLHLKKQF